MLSYQPLIQRSPDAGSSTGGASAIPPKVVKTPKFPAKADDFVAVTKKVFATWASYPTLTLLWITEADFKLKALQYGDAQNARSTAGGDREATTQSLANLDKKAAAALPFLKGYIREKWETTEDAQAQYARYGLDKRGTTYTFPRDRQLRAAAMQLTINAVAKDGFGAEKYGSIFWANLLSDYNVALSAAGTQDSTVSTGVSTKRNMRAYLVKAMTALQYIIRANYPDDVDAKFREWGWQKEDY